MVLVIEVRRDSLPVVVLFRVKTWSWRSMNAAHLWSFFRVLSNCTKVELSVRGCYCSATWKIPGQFNKKAWACQACWPRHDDWQGMGWSFFEWIKAPSKGRYRRPVFYDFHVIYWSFFSQPWTGFGAVLEQGVCFFKGNECLMEIAKGWQRTGNSKKLVRQVIGLKEGACQELWHLSVMPHSKMWNVLRRPNVCSSFIDFVIGNTFASASFSCKHFLLLPLVFVLFLLIQQ